MLLERDMRRVWVVCIAAAILSVLAIARGDEFDAHFVCEHNSHTGTVTFEYNVVEQSDASTHVLCFPVFNFDKSNPKPVVLDETLATLPVQSLLYNENDPNPFLVQPFQRTAIGLEPRLIFWSHAPTFTRGKGAVTWHRVPDGKYVAFLVTLKPASALKPLRDIARGAPEGLRFQVVCGAPTPGEILSPRDFNDNQVTYEQPLVTRTVFPCTQTCPIGTGTNGESARPCTATADRICGPCAEGFFNSGDSDRCRACSPRCPVDHGVNGLHGSPCASSHNRVCGLCARPRPTSDLLCEGAPITNGSVHVECSPTCGAGTGTNGKDGVACTSARDRVCGPCAEGFYNRGDSALCIACSATCGSTTGVNGTNGVACTVSADRTCGPCPKDFSNDGSHLFCVQGSQSDTVQRLERSLMLTGGRGRSAATTTTTSQTQLFTHSARQRAHTFPTVVRARTSQFHPTHAYAVHAESSLSLALSNVTVGKVNSTEPVSSVHTSVVRLSDRVAVEPHKSNLSPSENDVGRTSVSNIKHFDGTPLRGSPDGEKEVSPPSKIPPPHISRFSLAKKEQENFREKEMEKEKEKENEELLPIVSPVGDLQQHGRFRTAPATTTESALKKEAVLTDSTTAPIILGIPDSADSLLEPGSLHEQLKQLTALSSPPLPLPPPQRRDGPLDVRPARVFAVRYDVGQKRGPL